MKTIIIDGVEYNLTPKARFKKGDWIINNDKRIAVPTQILKIEKYGYGTSMGYTSFDKVKTDYHLWTIQDAKNGDVLAEHETIVLFKKIEDQNIRCYCTYHYLGFNPAFYVDTLQNKNPYRPATKEQCDLLFRKMKEAGYEWDAEKKELKKIEQKSAWSEEDEYQINTILHGLDLKRELYKKEGNKVEEDRYNTQYNWLKSIKNKVATQEKVEWNEEDEKMISDLIDLLNGGKTIIPTKTYINWLNSIKNRAHLQLKQCDEKDEKIREGLINMLSQDKEIHGAEINWLKSLKPQNRWKPSEEQLIALKNVIIGKRGPLYELYFDLEKL